MHIVARIADQLGLVRIGIGDLFLKPVEAEQVEVVVAARLKAGNLLVDDPLDGFLAVLYF